MSFSPDDKLLVAADNGGTIYFFDVATNREWFRLPRAQKGVTKRFAWSADGSRLWSAGMDGSLRLLGTTAGLAHKYGAIETAARGSSLALHPSSRQLAVASTSSAGSSAALNRDTGEVERELSPATSQLYLPQEADGRSSIAAMGSARRLTSEKLAVVWDLATGKEVALGG